MSTLTIFQKEYIYWTCCATYTAIAVAFFGLRAPELASLAVYSVTGGFLVVLANVALLSLFLSPSKTIGYMLRRFALITLVLAQIKQNLDHDIKLNIKFKDLQDHVAIVTGGNSGTGLAIAKQLVGLGSTVIITCRSELKCKVAAADIANLYPQKQQLLVPMLLDLDDLVSVKKFAKSFMKRFNRLDILVNNAGLVSSPGAQTAQGLEQSFGAMHIGHFALTKYLLKLILKPLPQGQSGAEAARIINIASDGLFTGNFHPTLMSGTGAGDFSMELTDNCGYTSLGIDCCPLLACPNTNGYARAKLANVLHAYELQRRVDDYVLKHGGSGGSASKKFRRLVTASLHPGSVHTNIATLLSSKIVSFFLRSADQAAYIIMHAILDESFVPSSYIDAMRKPHDFFHYEENYLLKHLIAYPIAASLPFANNSAKSVMDDRFTVHRLGWQSKHLIQPAPLQDGRHLELHRKEAVASRLWDVSEQIVRDFEKGSPVLKTKIPIKASSSAQLTIL